MRKKAKTDTLRRELGRLNLDGELGDPDTAALISADGKVAIGDFHDEIKDQMGFGDDDWDWKERFLGGGGVRVRTECGKGCIEFGHGSPTTYQRVRDIIDALPGDEFVLKYGDKHAKGNRDTILAMLDNWEKGRGES